MRVVGRRVASELHTIGRALGCDFNLTLRVSRVLEVPDCHRVKHLSLLVAAWVGNRAAFQALWQTG